MRVLVVDIGGTNVKILATGEKEPRKFPSGRKLTPEDDGRRGQGARRRTGSTTRWRSATRDGSCDGRIMAEPQNLGSGWVGFDFGRRSGVRSGS